jgi:hypothetical protein
VGEGLVFLAQFCDVKKLENFAKISEKVVRFTLENHIFQKNFPGFGKFVFLGNWRRKFVCFLGLFIQ